MNRNVQPIMNMKSKLQSFSAIFVLILSLGAALGQTSAPATTPTFDPTTGQPIPPVAPPEWKDPNWKDPDIVLTNVNFEGLPIGEIANFIRDQFKGQFDIILPNPTSGDSINLLTGAPVVNAVLGLGSIDWRSETVLNLRLKDVTASELFNAMNLIFENDKTPLKWELKVNGHRQLALLRVLVDPPPQAPRLPAPPEPLRRVYFVGDLIGDEKSGGMTLDQIIKTITDIWQMTDTVNGKIQFHNQAQLLVVTGTPGQIDFVDRTLEALHEKVELARQSLKASEAKSKADESKK